MTPWIRDGADSDGGRWMGREPMLSPRQFLAVIFVGLLACAICAAMVWAGIVWLVGDMNEVCEF